MKIMNESTQKGIVRKDPYGMGKEKYLYLME